MTTTFQLPNGDRVSVEGDSILIGRDPACDLALPDAAMLQSQHAKVRRMAGRWLVESLGSWFVQVGDESPGLKGWLKPGDTVRLSESGPEIVFEPTTPAASSLAPAATSATVPPTTPASAADSEAIQETPESETERPAIAPTSQAAPSPEPELAQPQATKSQAQEKQTIPTPSQSAVQSQIEKQKKVLSESGKSAWAGLLAAGNITKRKATVLKLSSQLATAKQAIGIAAYEQGIDCGNESRAATESHVALDKARQQVTAASEAMKSATGVKAKAVATKDLATAKATQKMAERKVGLAHGALGDHILTNDGSVPGSEEKISDAHKLQQQIEALDAEMGRLGQGLLKNKVGLAAVAGLVLVIVGVGVVTLRGLPGGGDKPGAPTAQVGPDAYCDRAFAYQENGQIEKAIEVLDEAIKLFPEHLAAYGMRGDIFLTTGDCNKAIASYTEVIRLDPGGGFAYDAYNKRGCAYRNRGDLENAIRDFTQAILCVPDSANSLHMRARCYGDLKQLDKSLADLDAAVRIRPDSSVFHSDRGIVYYRKGDYEQALTCFTEAVRLDPSSPDILGKRGAIYKKLGNAARAEADFAMAARLEEQLSSAHGADRGHSQDRQIRERPARQPPRVAGGGGWSDPSAPSAWDDPAAAEAFIRESQALLSRGGEREQERKRTSANNDGEASPSDADRRFKERMAEAHRRHREKSNEIYEMQDELGPDKAVRLSRQAKREFEAERAAAIRELQMENLRKQGASPQEIQSILGDR